MQSRETKREDEDFDKYMENLQSTEFLVVYVTYGVILTTVVYGMYVFIKAHMF